MYWCIYICGDGVIKHNAYTKTDAFSYRKGYMWSARSKWTCEPNTKLFGLESKLWSDFDRNIKFESIALLRTDFPIAVFETEIILRIVEMNCGKESIRRVVCVYIKKIHLVKQILTIFSYTMRLFHKTMRHQIYTNCCEPVQCGLVIESINLNVFDRQQCLRLLAYIILRQARAQRFRLIYGTIYFNIIMSTIAGELYGNLLQYHQGNTIIHQHKFS